MSFDWKLFGGHHLIGIYAHHLGTCQNGGDPKTSSSLLNHPPKWYPQTNNPTGRGASLNLSIHLVSEVGPRRWSRRWASSFRRSCQRTRHEKINDNNSKQQNKQVNTQLAPVGGTLGGTRVRKGGHILTPPPPSACASFQLRQFAQPDRF